jgi:hypothetical protein
MMKYKKNSMEVIDRLKQLYSLNGKEKIYARMNIPVPALERYARETKNGPTGYPDIGQRILFWDDYLSIYADLEDDSIPCAYLTELDEGLYGALVGATDIRFLNDTSWGWVSSMTTPFIDDISKIYDLKMDEDNIWFKRYLEQLWTFKKGAEGKFGISHFTLIDSLNFLTEIRGATNAYMDMLDYPKEVCDLIDFAYRLNVWIHQRFFDEIGLYHGGTCSNLVQWIPGRIVGESVDAFHLTSPDTFEEWGRAPAERMFGHFDGGIVHLHSNGLHLLENVSTLKGLKCIVFGDEPFNPPVYLKISELDAKRGDMPCYISMPFDVFKEKLARRALPANFFYNVTGVPDVKSANETMEDVRKY